MGMFKDALLDLPERIPVVLKEGVHSLNCIEHGDYLGKTSVVKGIAVPEICPKCFEKEVADAAAANWKRIQENQNKQLKSNPAL